MFDEKPMTVCDECDCDLYEGDDAFEIDGKIMCEECFIEYVRDKFRYRLERIPIWEEHDE